MIEPEQKSQACVQQVDGFIKQIEESSLEPREKNSLIGNPIVKPAAEDGPEANLPDLIGLRDRALIGLMAYTFARIGAVTRMKVGDYFVQGRRRWVRLHEKGGKWTNISQRSASPTTRTVTCSATRLAKPAF